MSEPPDQPSAATIFYFLHPGNGCDRNDQLHHPLFSHLHDRTISDGSHPPYSHLSQLRADSFYFLLSAEFYESMVWIDEAVFTLWLGIDPFIIVVFGLRTS